MNYMLAVKSYAQQASVPQADTTLQPSHRITCSTCRTAGTHVRRYTGVYNRGERAGGGGVGWIKWGLTLKMDK